MMNKLKELIIQNQSSPDFWPGIITVMLYIPVAILLIVEYS